MHRCYLLSPPRSPGSRRCACWRSRATRTRTRSCSTASCAAAARVVVRRRRDAVAVAQRRCSCRSRDRARPPPRRARRCTSTGCIRSASRGRRGAVAARACPTCCSRGAAADGAPVRPARRVDGAQRRAARARVRRRPRRARRRLVDASDLVIAHSPAGAGRAAPPGRRRTAAATRVIPLGPFAAPRRADPAAGHAARRLLRRDRAVQGRRGAARGVRGCCRRSCPLRLTIAGACTDACAARPHRARARPARPARQPAARAPGRRRRGRAAGRRRRAGAAVPRRHDDEHGGPGAGARRAGRDPRPRDAPRPRRRDDPLRRQRRRPDGDARGVSRSSTRASSTRSAPPPTESAHERSWGDVATETLEAYRAALEARRERECTRRLLDRVAGDALYRTSGLLVVNLMVLAGLGFVFWTVAARLFADRRRRRPVRLGGRLHAARDDRRPRARQHADPAAARRTPSRAG